MRSFVVLAVLVVVVAGVLVAAARLDRPPSTINDHRHKDQP